MSPNQNIKTVVIHPLVLLSVVDHFNRIHKVSNPKRVIGILLGKISKNVLDISNSFAVPFDENEKDPTIFFLDHQYIENMYNMFRQVNARECVVGWYHTGPKLSINDIEINKVIKAFCPNAVLVIIQAKPKSDGLPTEAYLCVEQIYEDGTPPCLTFKHIPSEIGAEEAEEVGVEHLLRDIKDTTLGTLSQKITEQIIALKGLNEELDNIRSYLIDVSSGKMPINNQVIYLMQDIFNLMPDVTLSSFVKSTLIYTNDQLLTTYLATIIRSVIALHNLIDNQISNRDLEKQSKISEDKKKEPEGKKHPSKPNRNPQSLIKFLRNKLF